MIIWTGEGARAFCSGGDQRVRGDSGYKTDERAVRPFHVTDLHVQARLRPGTQLCDNSGTSATAPAPTCLQDGAGELSGGVHRHRTQGSVVDGVGGRGAIEHGEGLGSGGWERSAAPADILRMSLAVTDNGRSYLSQSRAEYQGGLSSGAGVREYLYPTTRVPETKDY